MRVSNDERMCPRHFMHLNTGVGRTGLWHWLPVRMCTESPGGLLKPLLSPTPASDPGSLGWGPRTCPSNQFPGEAAAGPGTHTESHCPTDDGCPVHSPSWHLCSVRIRKERVYGHWPKGLLPPDPHPRPQKASPLLPGTVLNAFTGRAHGIP